MTNNEFVSVKQALLNSNWVLYVSKFSQSSTISSGLNMHSNDCPLSIKNHIVNLILSSPSLGPIWHICADPSENSSKFLSSPAKIGVYECPALHCFLTRLLTSVFKRHPYQFSAIYDLYEIRIQQIVVARQVYSPYLKVDKCVEFWLKYFKLSEKNPHVLKVWCFMQTAQRNYISWHVF